MYGDRLEDARLIFHPSFGFRWWLRRERERLLFWTVNHLPRELVFHCGIRMMVHASNLHPQQHVPSLTLDQILRGWDEEPGD